MGHMGTYMVHIPLHVSGLILHGTFQTRFLGILYHKLSTFMLIRRFAWSFKCDFQIFEILGNYFIMTRVPLWYYGEGFHPDFSVIIWNFFKIFLLKKGLINVYLPSNLIRVLSNLSWNIRIFANSPYWPHGQHGAFVFNFHMQISWVTSLPASFAYKQTWSSVSARQPVWRIPIFRIFGL